MDRQELVMSPALSAAFSVIKRSDSNAIPIITACARIAEIAESCVNSDDYSPSVCQDMRSLRNLKVVASLLAVLRRYDDRAPACTAVMIALRGCVLCKVNAEPPEYWEFDQLMPAVLAILHRHKGNVELSRATCRLISAFAEEEDVSKHRLECSVLILEVLRLHGAVANVVSEACRALKAVLPYGDALRCGDFDDHGICILFVSLISRHSGPAAIACMEIFKEIALRLGGDALLRAGVADVLLRRLRGTMPAGEAGAAWDVLRTMASQGADVHKLFDAGALDALLTGLRLADAGLPESSFMQIMLLGAAHGFSQSHSARAAMISAGILPWLAKAFEVSLLGFTWQSCSLLARLSIDYSSCEPLISAGFLAVLDDFLGGFVGSGLKRATWHTMAASVHLCCAVARNFASVASCRAALLATPVPDRLLGILEQAASPPHVRREALGALRNLTAAPELRLPLHRRGATSRLLTFVLSDAASDAASRSPAESAAQAAACAALYGLSLEPAACAEMALQGTRLVSRALQLLQVHAADMRSAWAICGLLGQVVKAVPDEQVAIIMQEPLDAAASPGAAIVGAAAAVAALKAHVSDPRIAGAAGELISLLGPASRAAVAACGGSDAVAQAMAHAAGHARATAALSAALSAL